RRLPPHRQDNPLRLLRPGDDPPHPSSVGVLVVEDGRVCLRTGTVSGTRRLPPRTHRQDNPLRLLRPGHDPAFREAVLVSGHGTYHLPPTTQNRPAGAYHLPPPSTSDFRLPTSDFRLMCHVGGIRGRHRGGWGRASG